MARIFGRLVEHEPQICVSGRVVNPHRMSFSEVWYVPFMWDPDFVWDLVPIPAHQRFVFERASHPRCADDGTPLLHCEIDSAVRNAACLGGLIGSIVGAAIGLALLLPLLAACAFALILCALIAFVVGALVAYVGSWLGGLIGAGIGYLIDAATDAGEEHADLVADTCIAVTGRWVIDNDHGWNEIHPVTAFTPPARDEAGNPIRDPCPQLCEEPVIG